ncbi:MAG: 4'-phosphopantetheinyl transferase superfamily protein [Desulfobacterales bacterium]|nr:4'-phosphopantetheinyl transferase superfamily protein [Desulfobacterales bacterium]
MKRNKADTIYPVILFVPYSKQQLKGRDRVAFLSRHARRALRISSLKSGIGFIETFKDKNGMPLPFGGNYWSLTHKPKYVGAVVAAGRIGIDIEEIRQCSQSLFEKIATDREWELTDANPDILFFRYWTSKECILKYAGTGLKDLSKCRIAEVIDDYHLVIRFRENNFLISHHYFDNHIVSIISDDFQIKWIFIPEEQIEPFDRQSASIGNSKGLWLDT